MKIRHYKLGDISRNKLKLKKQRVLDITLLGMFLGVVLGATILINMPKANELPLSGRVEIASASIQPITEKYGDWRSYPILEGGSEAQNEVIRYAWEISGQDIEFIYMLRGENGLFDYQRVHNPRGNTIGTDMGLCGVNSYFHPQIVTDPRFMTDWKWQLDTCYRLWAGGTTFYGRSTKGITIY